jgi:hypothetical protein
MRGAQTAIFADRLKAVINVIHLQTRERRVLPA